MAHPPSDILVDKILLSALDGYPLTAYRYYASTVAKGNLIVAGATGVQQRFYRRFAEYAVSRGFNVLTLDYRGVGESRPATLKGFEMSYLDWAYQDLAAAVAMLGRESLPIYWVGHSFGGHAIGLLPNHHRLSACYSFGSGAGWSGWMPKHEARKVRLLWNFILPLIVKWKGYMAWSMLGMGDDLPRGVYQDWRRWCRFPHYYFDDPEMQHVVDLYASVTTRCRFVTSEDDPWAPPRSRDAFVKGYRNALLEVGDLEPPVSGSIGHMGYFRAGAEHFWDECLRWLTARTDQGLMPVQAVREAHAARSLGRT
ncbi:alpha/beta hydrolase family protein [Pseudomonas muyukensis]|uniref:Alpha/beta fold hydrolase n=1 Tax=Pseudomonas muyukensis TaxID=2842357 RepID=A0ABX8MG11_9PSED|nr:alpha/beta fold hydrolase [Pseudomonas muyukensis]QXH37542.1 alpha/beta fold hydrolase [Pseudomonas muyukensis]